MAQIRPPQIIAGLCMATTRKRQTRKRRTRKGGGKFNLHKRSVSPPELKCSVATDGKRPLLHSCYTPDVLLKIRDEYNAAHRENPIQATSTKALWTELRKRLRPTCRDQEQCWLNQIKDPARKREIERILFLPKKPPKWQKNPNEWLTNHDILRVLHQYESRYTCFKFVGPVPIDFDAVVEGECVSPELCKLDLSRIPAAKKRIGVIFNLDKHNEPGSHWVALYVDLPAGIIFYFDSTGEDIPPQIQALVDRLAKQALALNPPITLEKHKNHPTEHQMENTECGVYCLFFIITMLTCKTEFHPGELTTQQKLDLFKKETIPDKYIEQYRNVYFTE